MLPLEDMYDTIYHPNDIGRAKISAFLAQQLCKQLACPAAGGKKLEQAGNRHSLPTD